MINKGDVEEVLEAVTSRIEDVAVSVKQLVGDVPRDYETLWEKNAEGKTILSKSEDTDEELLIDIAAAQDDIKDGLQALWVAVCSFVEDKKGGPK